MIEELEARLSWRPSREVPLAERINRVGEALLGLKELEYFGSSQAGEVSGRLDRLINRLLQPLEQEWLKIEETSERLRLPAPRHNVCFAPESLPHLKKCRDHPNRSLSATRFDGAGGRFHCVFTK